MTEKTNDISNRRAIVSLGESRERGLWGGGGVGESVKV